MTKRIELTKSTTTPRVQILHRSIIFEALINNRCRVRKLRGEMDEKLATNYLVIVQGNFPCTPYIYKSVFFLILAPERRGVIRIEIDDASRLCHPLSPSLSFFLPFLIPFTFSSFSFFLSVSFPCLLLFRSDTRCAQITDSPGSAWSPPWSFVVSFFRIVHMYSFYNATSSL